jgi:K+-transporting ATPase A subunit
MGFIRGLVRRETQMLGNFWLSAQNLYALGLDLHGSITATDLR